ncbi:hypothetical protein ABGV42_13440 [Paenibacillus pabuli]|uniref:hypothetical protein n=1 Tax=Paenibacillus pabuli TaxID=1472 RepID=UPI003242BACA
MIFQTRKETQLKLRKNRRDIVFSRKIRKFFRQFWKLSKFLLLSVVLSFIVSVVAFDYVSTEYDTLQVKQEELENKITARITAVKGEGREQILFNISYFDSDIVILGKSKTEFVDVKFRIVQDRFPNDILEAELDSQIFDNIEDVQFLMPVKRESPTTKHLFLNLKSTHERVGSAELIINKNFNRSVQARIEVEAKSKFSRFIHKITTIITD